MDLPFPVQDTLFIHCSAGAFNFTKSNTSPPPIFGYCFVGSLESMTNLCNEERNIMTLAPTQPPSKSPLGASGGDIYVL
jgi:hypothetical protein